MVKHFVQNPLPSSFMIGSMVGFLFTVTILWDYSLTWSFTFAFTFAIMFIASVYNFTHAPGYDHLDIHGSRDYVRRTSRLKKK